jgi:hypothetical protein
MATETTSEEFKRFLLDDNIWDDAFAEDVELDVDGQARTDAWAPLPDNARITIRGGWVDGLPQPVPGMTLEEYFAWWRDGQPDRVNWFRARIKRDPPR